MVPGVHDGHKEEHAPRVGLGADLLDKFQKAFLPVPAQVLMIVRWGGRMVVGLIRRFHS